MKRETGSIFIPGLHHPGRCILGICFHLYSRSGCRRNIDVEVLIQIPDEEKYWARQNLGMSLDEYHKLAEDAVLNIAALGFKHKEDKDIP